MPILNTNIPELSGFDTGLCLSNLDVLSLRQDRVNESVLAVLSELAEAIIHDAEGDPDTVDSNGFDADIVIVALGTNDYSGDFTADQIRSGCAEYLKRLSAIYKHSKMFYVTPIWRADGADIYAAGTHMDVCRVIAEEAELHGFTVIDGYSLVPHDAALFADGFLHPNDEGFSHYARNLIAALNAYL